MLKKKKIEWKIIFLNVSIKYIYFPNDKTYSLLYILIYLWHKSQISVFKIFIYKNKYDIIYIKILKDDKQLYAIGI